ncbi:hypothetical protein [Fonticella tunisiensis]|uniref:Uncharacterized protein n=1 Tax=Fonticella tunisiensis TaxID=1096341 RepID=A0A4R7K4X3_9CLOT|nr:hypothetical protein [Fonticella tunisiensis]TDT46050.1 hypothetical protein EDD71_1386 [Fonticella tunisiensis]
MGHGNNPHGRKIDDLKRYRVENARRVDQLIDLVEKHTRTKRHLEQHSDIASLDALQHAFKIQEERERQIEHLKDIIVSGKHAADEIASLERNYRYTNNYISHHEGHMDDFTLQKTREKQEHRLEQLGFHKQNDLQ